MSPEANDGHDVCLALEGDGEAFGRLIARYQRAVTRLLRPYAGDAARLEELVQETFVEAYFSLGSWRGDGAFGKWIEVIAVRTGYRHLRRQYRDRKISRAASLFARSGDLGQAAAADGSDAADQIAASDESAALLSLLDDLRPRDRLVLTLMHLEDRPVREVARMTGWSESMVKVQAHRARKRLRTLAEDRGLTEPSGTEGTR